MIIGISGLVINDNGVAVGTAGSGKDTLADLLRDNDKFVKIALADPLKRIVRDVYDFTDEQLWGPSANRNEPDKRYPQWSECPWCLVQGKHLKPVHRVIDYLDFEGLACPNEKCNLRLGYLTPREALQKLGTEWGRACYPDTWVDYGMRTAKKLITDASIMYTAKEGLVEKVEQTSMGEWKRDDAPVDKLGGVAIPDVRFWNEVHGIRRQGGFLVRVKRRGEGLYGDARKHLSEVESTQIPDASFDFVIDNNGTIKDLAHEAAVMLEALRRKAA